MSGLTVVVFGKANNIISAKPPEKTSNIRIGGSSPSKFSVFMYFAKISEVLHEDKWKSFFEVLSKGQFWKGLKFENNYLKAKGKSGKSIQLVCSGDMNIETDMEADRELYEQCKRFIIENTTHFSKIEEEKTLQQGPEEPAAADEDRTASLKLGVLKQRMYITEFALRCARDYGFDNSTREALISSIFSKLSGKAISTKCFKMSSDGRIRSIDGLELYDGGYRFEEPPRASRTRRKKVIEEDEDDDAVSKRLFVFKCSKNLSIIQKKDKSCHAF